MSTNAEPQTNWTPARTTKALDNLTVLVQYDAAVRSGRRDQRKVQLAAVAEGVRSLWRLAPELIDPDLAAALADAANKLGVDLSGKR